MSLQQMAGPINATIDPDDSTIGGVGGFAGPKQVLWLDEIGWFGRADSVNMTGVSNSSYVTCNLDGVMRLRTYLTAAAGILGIEQDDLTNNIIVHYAAGTPYSLNPYVGGLQPPVALNAMTDGYIRTKVGWYRLSGAAIQHAPLDAADSSAFATEYTVTGGNWNINSSFWRISLGPDNLIYCYDGNVTNPTILAYDYVAKTEVFPNPGNPGERWELDHHVDAVFYSRHLNCFMTFEEDALTAGLAVFYIYSTELEPNALSAPTADPAVTAGVVSAISTTLTDDKGCGIPGRLIDWSITVGNGDLLDTQTTTDEDGIATTYYRAPITGGVNPTIQASLTY
jgi:hypothetical protein